MISTMTWDMGHGTWDIQNWGVKQQSPSIIAHRGLKRGRGGGQRRRRAAMSIKPYVYTVRYAQRPLPWKYQAQAAPR